MASVNRQCQEIVTTFIRVHQQLMVTLGDASPVRKKYETKEDRQRERKVANLLGFLWQCDMIEQPKLSVLDYSALRDGELKSFVEIRCRNHKYGDFPDVFISPRKINKAIDISPIPVLFAVRWNDKMGWVRLRKDMLDTQIMGGRTRNPRDKWDIEMLCRIKIEEFKIV